MELDKVDIAALERAGELALGYGLELAGALAILVVGWIVAGWIHRRLLKVLDRTPRVDKTLRPVIASIVRYVILIFVVIAVLAQFGVQTTSIIAVLGAAGLAVGLALQGTLQNIAAGFMLLFLRPFQIGDYINAEGVEGTVLEIGLFVTEMKTFNGMYLAVPHSRLWGSTILSYTRHPTRRTDLTVGIGYGDDIDKAQTVLMELLTSEPRILDDPAPQIFVKELADSSVNLTLRAWSATADSWTLGFDLTKAIKQRLDAEGISIPFPQRDVHLIKDEKA